MTTLKANNTSLTYRELDVFNDISDINSDQGSMHTDCLTGFQVDVKVTAKNRHGDEADFYLVFQTEETNSRIMAYSGFGMESGHANGCDACQFSELEEFFNWEMGAWELLLDEVEKLSKIELESLT